MQVIGGCGGCGEKGSTVELYTNAHRYLRQGTVGDTYPCTAAGLADLRRDWLEGKTAVPFSTLD